MKASVPILISIYSVNSPGISIPASLSNASNTSFLYTGVGFLSGFHDKSR